VTAHADVRPHRFQPWRTAAMGFCLTAVLGAAAMPAMASEPVRLGYRIYTGGFNVLDITIDLNIDPSAYRIDIGAETQGWIGKGVARGRSGAADAPHVQRLAGGTASGQSGL
jgi:hypothetical protein